MATLFDLLTVATFLALVIGFVLWTDRDTRTLLHFCISGVVLAIANQLGNSGSPLFGAVLILVGVGYAVLVGWPRTS